MSLKQSHAWIVLINQRIEQIAKAMNTKLEDIDADIQIERMMEMTRPLRQEEVDRSAYWRLKPQVDILYKEWCQ